MKCLSDRICSQLVRRSVVLGGLLGIVIAISLASGCGSSKEQARPGGLPAAGPPAAAVEEHAAPAAAASSSPAKAAPLAKADPEGLKELSPEDRALAETQAICPVSKEPLGSMGTPVKMVHGTRTVFLCCSGCEEDFRKAPEKYLAQLESGKHEGHDHHQGH